MRVILTPFEMSFISLPTTISLSTNIFLTYVHVPTEGHVDSVGLGLRVDCETTSMTDMIALQYSGTEEKK